MNRRRENMDTLGSLLLDIHNSVSDEEKYFADLKYAFSRELFNYLKEKNINKKDFAKKLGKTEKYVSKILSGDRNLTLWDISLILSSINASLKFQIIENSSSDC